MAVAVPCGEAAVMEIPGVSEGAHNQNPVSRVKLKPVASQPEEAGAGAAAGPCSSRCWSAHNGGHCECSSAASWDPLLFVLEAPRVWGSCASCGAHGTGAAMSVWGGEWQEVSWRRWLGCTGSL